MDKNPKICEEEDSFDHPSHFDYCDRLSDSSG